MHVTRGLHNDLTAIHYAIQNDNIDMLKILLEDLKTPKKDRCPFPTVTMTTQSTGRLINQCSLSLFTNRKHSPLI